MDNEFILEKYVERALSSYDSRAIPRSNLIMCRCPVCGDSERNKNTRRGYFLKGSLRHDFWVYCCHNGFCLANEAMSVINLLKNYFPNVYAEYRKEIYLGNYFSDNSKEFHKIKKYEEKKIEEVDDVKHFVSILKGSGEVFDMAIKLCQDRKIPENVWKKFYVAESGFFQGRMIIPFFNNDGKIVYYQGRTLIGSDPKYKNRRFGEKHIYGISFVDSSKPVVVLEGPVDSTFVKNSIAVLGLKFSDKFKKEVEGMSLYYLLDNDDSGRRNSLKMLQKDLYVFNWKKFLKDNSLSDSGIKDVNDLVIKTGKCEWSFEDFKKYFTNDVVEGIWFK